MQYTEKELRDSVSFVMKDENKSNLSLRYMVEQSAIKLFLNPLEDSDNGSENIIKSALHDIAINGKFVFKKEIDVSVEVELEPYCYECGNDDIKEMIYKGCTASGEHYECKHCKTEATMCPVEFK